MRNALVLVAAAVVSACSGARPKAAPEEPPVCADKEVAYTADAAGKVVGRVVPCFHRNAERTVSYDVLPMPSEQQPAAVSGAVPAAPAKAEPRKAGLKKPAGGK